MNTFRNWCLQHTQRKLGQRHVYHWVTSPFILITLCNDLGTEDIKYCSFASGIFAHSCCIQDLSCSTVHGRRHLIPLHVAGYVGDRSGLQAGHSSTCTLCLRSHAVVTGIALLKSYSEKQAEMWTCLTREHVSTVFRSISDDHALRTHQHFYAKWINAFLFA